MPVTQKRHARIACRIRSEDKMKIANAADLMGLSTSEFLISRAIEAADNILHSHQNITLSERDWDIVMDAVNTPAEPNELLRQAAARFKDGKDTGDSYEW